ncbi:MAG: HDOD domain-containing protein [bacterium]|nr:HDOD domain-containing protein [bacterium]
MSQAVQQTDLQAIRDELEKEIATGRASLPVLPDVAIRMKSAAAKPTSNASDLARILELDPALSARVLKMANSMMFAGRTEIRSLDTAIGRLGAAMAVAVVVGAAGKEVFRSTTPEYNTYLTANWKSALFTSAAARRLSHRVGLKSEDVFLAGLLNGCGDSVLVQSAETLSGEGRLVPKPSIDTLSEAIGPIGPEAGAAVLGNWGLPDPLVQAVRFQRDPDSADDEQRVMARIVGLSAAIGAPLSRGESVDAVVDLVATHAAVGALGLDDGALRQVVEESEVDGNELTNTL